MHGRRRLAEQLIASGNLIDADRISLTIFWLRQSIDETSSPSTGTDDVTAEVGKYDDLGSESLPRRWNSLALRGG
jgi:hypothetical protein